MPKRRPATHPTRLQTIASLTLAIVAAPFLCISCLGQASSAPASQADAGVVNVNEVTLNLMVRDKKGNPVLDLKPEDIAVTDGGTP
jgi:ABC-type enterochelin transport system substrate-binding protein